MTSDFSESVLSKWTPTAKECYESQCDCSSCGAYRVVGDSCKMKEIVWQLKARLGDPPEHFQIHERKLNNIGC